MPWIVAMTKPNHERIALANLQNQGFVCYLPLCKQRRKPVGPWSIRPVFPRYMFVAQEQMWRSMTGTRGISYVLSNDDGPCTLPDAEIDRIKAREDKHGIVQLADPPKFLIGEKVKAQDGPWAGHLLIYDGMLPRERVRVLFEMMGRKVPIEVDEKLLVAA